MKYHGGVDLANLTIEDTEALDRGLVNLERHVENITKVYNLPCVVSINTFTSDTAAEIALIEERMQKLGVNIVLATHRGEGGKGAADLARLVVDLCESNHQQMQYVYEDEDTLWEKINKIAKKVYRASEVTADTKVLAQIESLQNQGYGHYPLCVAKTQSSFSTNPKSRALQTIM
jgi:formate--tetrahydrofolate ligase